MMKLPGASEVTHKYVTLQMFDFISWEIVSWIASATQHTLIEPWQCWSKMTVELKTSWIIMPNGTLIYGTGTWMVNYMFYAVVMDFVMMLNICMCDDG